MRHAATMRDHFDVVMQVATVVGDSDRFVRGIQAHLLTAIMRRYACGAGILVALERLEATEGKHEPAGGTYEGRPGAQRPRDIGGDDKFPDATIGIFASRRWRRNMSRRIGSDSWIGSPTLSIKAIGAAPVPPSPESRAKKSGSIPRFTINTIRSSSHP
jgi:hypothetical protein